MEKTKKAIIAGATGLVGGHLLNLLIANPEYIEIIVLSRRELTLSHPKIRFVKSDYSNKKLLVEEIHGDVLFCCLGTTIKKAGSKKAFEWVDLEIPKQLSEIARINKVNSFVMVTSMGANPGSWSFYNRTKGKVEAAVIDEQINQTIICRPSLLLGKREEIRTLESAGMYFFKFFGWIFVGPLKKYQAIQAHQVAKAMVHYYNKLTKGLYIITSDKLQVLN